MKLDTSTGMRVPDFFIVGQPKSSTTALYEMLTGHSEIFMPDLKEPMFLAADLRSRFSAPMKGPLPRTLEEYLTLFADGGPHQQLGEVTTLYLFSHLAARSIAALNQAARSVAIFREPASFLYSLHLQLRQDHQENSRNLRRAMALEPRRAQGRRIPRMSYRPQDLKYSEHVRYTEQLRRYHTMFPPDQVLTLIYDDYRRDNETTVRRVFEFLGVDCSEPLVPTRANPTVALRSQRIDDMVHRFSVGRGPISRVAKAGVKAVVGPSARRRLLHGVQSRIVYSTPAPPDEEMLAELRVLLRPEVDRFSAYVGRDLVTLWGYDGV